MKTQSLQKSQPFSPEDIVLLKKAKHDLENVSFLIRVFNTIGTPIDTGLLLLPEKYQGKIHLAIQKALHLSLKANLKTLKRGKEGVPSSNLLYKMVTGASGAAGGFFGAAGFTADLILTTKFMMRSIMDIARSQGEDIDDIKVQLACLQVFALGSDKSSDDDAMDTSYYATRTAMQTALNQANTYIAKHGTKSIIEAVASQTASPIAKLINMIAARYSIQVSEKFAAQALPIIGAAAGASTNVIFISHFQKMAAAHFTLRRLERKYGMDTVQGIYKKTEEISQ